jgi:hypothetical protein
VFDDATFDLLASYQLGPNEIPNAVASMSFGGSSGSNDAAAGAGPSSSAAAALGSTREEDPPQYFIVGTAVIKPNVSHCTACVQLCSMSVFWPMSQRHGVDVNNCCHHCCCRCYYHHMLHHLLHLLLTARVFECC